mgnify:CR=1 FL=1
MNREDLNRALASAESWTERLLLWVVGLPPPLTFIVVVLNLIAAAYIGYRLA